MTLVLSTLQIRMHDYSEYLNFVILILGFVIDIRTYYNINLNVMSLFTDSSLLIFSEIEYIIILIDALFINLND
jgi:hypothetical protein